MLLLEKAVEVEPRVYKLDTGDVLGVGGCTPIYGLYGDFRPERLGFGPIFPKQGI